MKEIKMTIYLKSGNKIVNNLGVANTLQEVQSLFDEKLKQEIFDMASEEQGYSIPTDNIDYYDLELVSDD